MCANRLFGRVSVERWARLRFRQVGGWGMASPCMRSRRAGAKDNRANDITDHNSHNRCVDFGTNPRVPFWGCGVPVSPFWQAEYRRRLRQLDVMAVQAGFSGAKPNQDRFVHFSASTKDVAQIVWKTDVNFQLREACMLLLNFHEAGQTWADNKLGSICPVLAVSVISARPKKQSPCFASGRRVAMKDLQFVLKQTKSRCNAKELQ